MNPYALLVGALVFAGAVSSAYFYGIEVGSDREVAADAREKKIAAIATDAAASAAANAISRIEVKNVTIQNKLQREVLTREVFRDCRSGDNAVQLLNSGPAIAPAASGAAGSGQLPASGASR
jgi:hypothetical protein